MLKRLGRALRREAARTLALFVLVTAAMFALLDLAPGDPLALYVNIESLSAGEIAEARRELGLDRPHEDPVPQRLQIDFFAHAPSGLALLSSECQTG